MSLMATLRDHQRAAQKEGRQARTSFETSENLVRNFNASANDIVKSKHHYLTIRLPLNV